MRRKGKHHSLLVRLQTGAITTEINVKDSDKAENKFTKWSSDITPWQTPKGLNTLFQRYLLKMFLVALFTTVKKWKQSK